MPAPFYNAIKGTTAGTPGAGAFTPNVASAGFFAWSKCRTGWIGLVRFVDGTDFSLEYCFWNGTTLSRASTQVALMPDGTLATSTGSHLSLTVAATAQMVADAAEVGSHVGGPSWRGWIASPGTAANPLAVGNTVQSVVGTATTGTLSSSNSALQAMARHQSTSLTTANAQASYTNTSAFVVISSTAFNYGGFDLRVRFGATGLPTGPRLFIGATGTTFVGVTTEPSALTANYVTFAKDSTDTNIQLLVNSNAGSGTKTDTGLPFTVNNLYEAALWVEPGTTRVFGRLINFDTGAIWMGTTTTDVPSAMSSGIVNVIGGLNGTNTGTAIVFCVLSALCRTGP